MTGRLYTLRELLELRDEVNKLREEDNPHKSLEDCYAAYSFKRYWHPELPPWEFGECVERRCERLVSLDDYVKSDPICEFNFESPTGRLEKRILYIRVPKEGVDKE